MGIFPLLPVHGIIVRSEISVTFVIGSSSHFLFRLTGIVLSVEKKTFDFFRCVPDRDKDGLQM